LVLEHDTPDAGEVRIERNSSVGHLPQETAAVGEETVLELATAIPEEAAEFLGQTARAEGEEDSGGPGVSGHATLTGPPVRTMSGGLGDGAPHLARLLVQQPGLACCSTSRTNPS